MRTPEEFTAYANGLRALADWLEHHPEIGELPETVVSLYGLNEKEEAVVLARAMGNCKKDYNEDFFYLEKAFGPLRLRSVFYRSKVCTRRVVGVETVPARLIPAQTIPAKTVETVEWDCEPLLAPPQDDSLEPL